jgi:hypothetical protein
LTQVRIALPEGLRIAVVEPRIAVVIGLIKGIATPGQLVAVGEQDRMRRVRLGLR